MDGTQIERLLTGGQTSAALAAKAAAQAARAAKAAANDAAAIAQVNHRLDLATHKLATSNDAVLVQIVKNQHDLTAQLAGHAISLAVICSIAGFLKDKDAVILTDCKAVPATKS